MVPATVSVFWFMSLSHTEKRCVSVSLPYCSCLQKKNWGSLLVFFLHNFPVVRFFLTRRSKRCSECVTEKKALHYFIFPTFPLVSSSIHSIVIAFPLSQE